MDSIALNLPQEYREKLAHIQTLTQQDDQTAILRAIDLYYTQLVHPPDPLASADNTDNTTPSAPSLEAIAQARGILKSKKHAVMDHLNQIRQDWERR